MPTSSRDSRVYAAIMVAQLLDSVAAGISMPVVPYLALSLGASALVVASLVSVQMLSGALGAPFLGWLSDRVSPRAALLVALCTVSACYWLQIGARTVWALIVLRAVTGFMSSNLVILESIIARMTESRDRTAGIARLRLGSTLGLILGPGLAAALGGLHLTEGVLPLLWIVALVQSLVPIVIASALREMSELRGFGAHRRVTYPRLLQEFLATPRIRDYAGIKACIATCFALLTALSPIWSRMHLAWTPTELSGQVVLFGLSLFIIQVTVATRRARWLTSEAALVVACGLAVPAFGALVLWPSAASLASCSVAMGLSCAVVNIVVPATISSLTPLDVGAMLGIVSASVLVSSTLGPMVAGTIYERFGGAWAWFGGVVFAGMAAALAIKQFGAADRVVAG